MKGFLVTLILVFVAWIALTTSLSIAELILGLAISFIVTLVSNKFLHPERPGMIFNPLRWGGIMMYLAFLARAEIVSHLDVIKRIFTGEVKPAIVEIRTSLKTDSAKMVLGNSITLTPGTLTLRVERDRMYVHTLWHDKKREIGEMFERYWGRVSGV